MSKAYKKYLYGGEVPDQATSSLYSGISSPFKPLQFPEVVNSAVTTPEPIEDILTRPRVDLLSKIRNSVQITENIQKMVSPEIPRMSDDSLEPNFPSVNVIPSGNTKGFDAKKFTADTSSRESGGDYRAQSKSSSAVGKYQFLWNTWKDSIKKVTGIQDKQDFRNNPAAQEKFYGFYLNTVIKPAADKLAPLGSKYGLTPTEVGRIVHFQGSEGARKALQNGTLNRATKINPSIMEYLGKSPAKKK